MELPSSNDPEQEKIRAKHEEIAKSNRGDLESLVETLQGQPLSVIEYELIKAITRYLVKNLGKAPESVDSKLCLSWMLEDVMKVLKGVNDKSDKPPSHEWDRN